MVAICDGRSVLRSEEYAETSVEFSGNDIELLQAFLGRERLKRLTIRASFARGMLAVSRDVDMIMEFNYPPDLGAALASMKFALKGILKLKIDVETSSGVGKCLSVFINGGRVLIFEE
ncbi:MAG TPA: hypothetical protein VF473_10200 [Cyclobacteriaceae bacterium]